MVGEPDESLLFEVREETLQRLVFGQQTGRVGMAGWSAMYRSTMSAAA